jgi:hypothetical protein
MTTLAQLPQGFNPTFAPQTMQAPTGQPMNPQWMQSQVQPQMMGQPQMATGGNMLPNLGNKMAMQKQGTAAAGGGGGDKDWGQFFKDFLTGNGLELLGSGATIAGALDTANDTRKMGSAMMEYLEGMGNSLNDDSQFQGYGVTTGIGTGGTVGYNKDTGEFEVDLGLGDNGGMNTNAQLAANAAFDAASNAATQAGIPITERQDTIYNQIMATQNPELNRMQTEQQAAEYAMGRGGIRGSQYGGTAEDAAMARARTMASNDAAFRAREMANDERGMLGNLAAQMGGFGSQALGAAYTPMNQQMEAMKLGVENSKMAQTGQLTGLNYLAQLGLGGADANINAMHSANQLTADLYKALFNNLGGVQGENGSAGSGLLGAIGGGITDIWDFIQGE